MQGLPLSSSPLRMSISPCGWKPFLIKPGLLPMSPRAGALFFNEPASEKGDAECLQA
jgi:hypothetical protein